MGTKPDRLHVFREYELKSVMQVLSKGMRVLELGAGDGFLAQKLEEAGCDVTCLEIVEPTGETFHKILVYDGHSLPFEDNSFDAVFSCHMLYHVISDHDYLKEAARVLKPGGVAAHIMPTPTWRLLTAAGYYPYLLRSVMARFRKKSGSAVAASSSASTSSDETPRPSAARSKFAKLFSPPLSQAPSWFAEMRILSARNVRRRVTNAGLEYVGNRSTGVIYTAYRVLQGLLPFPVRRALAVLLGSSSRAFVFRKP